MASNEPSKRCRGCGGPDLRLFLDLGELPLAGAFLRSHEDIATEQRFPLCVHCCGTCGLVQIVDAIDPGILFRDYAFSSSTVGALVEHFQDYANWLEHRFHPATVVEFGCNDGILLAPLRRLGIDAVGVDPSENIGEIGRQAGHDIVTGYFDTDAALTLRARLGPVDVVTGSNAFAHNARPEEIIKAASILLRHGGWLCLEVMYVGDLFDQVQWDTLYHEHLTFYSLGTLEILLGRFGFSVVHAERISMHGGSLRLVATNEPKGTPSRETLAIAEYESVSNLNSPETWSEFGMHVQRKIDVVQDVLGLLSQTATIWGYGAAGKATMWVNACHLDYLGRIVDASPLRAGRLMPGTHTPIVLPRELRKDPPDFVFVTAWNYADLIRRNEAWFKGVWVTPLPEMCFF